MPQRLFSPGFRIDAKDVFVLVAGSVGAILLARLEWWLGVLVALPVANFFLFCNVFRVGKPLELTWSAAFLLLAGSTLATGKPGWTIAIGATMVTTVLVIVAQIRQPSYHGVAWQRLNPGLLEWWQAQAARSEK